jgi:hypothetical protein
MAGCLINDGACVLMKRFILLAFLFVSPVSYAESVTPIQIALFSPAQMFPTTYSVKGFRFNLIFGENVSVSGVDVGLINTSSDLHALQIGFISAATGSQAEGVQLGGWNMNSGIHGLQCGLINGLFPLPDSRMKGAQIGMVNMSYAASGLMVGWFNFNMNHMSGLQVGIMNGGIFLERLDHPTTKETDFSEVHGVQVGVLNATKKLKGIQIGLWNETDQLRGFQFGLFNYDRERKRFLPFINWNKTKD